MTDKLTKDDLKPGDQLVMSIGGRTMDVTVLGLGPDSFMTSFGLVPYSNLYLLKRKESSK